MIWVDYTVTYRDGASMGLTTTKELDMLGPFPSPAFRSLRILKYYY